MAQTQVLERAKAPELPMVLRPRVLLTLGWALLALSLLLLSFHLTWMWTRLGSARVVLAVACCFDAVVGIGLIAAGRNMARKQKQIQKAN